MYVYGCCSFVVVVVLVVVNAVAITAFVGCNTTFFVAFRFLCGMPHYFACMCVQACVLVCVYVCCCCSS